MKKILCMVLLMGFIAQGLAAIDAGVGISASGNVRKTSDYLGSAQEELSDWGFFVYVNTDFLLLEVGYCSLLDGLNKINGVTLTTWDKEAKQSYLDLAAYFKYPFVYRYDREIYPLIGMSYKHLLAKENRYGADQIPAMPQLVRDDYNQLWLKFGIGAGQVTDMFYTRAELVGGYRFKTEAMRKDLDATPYNVKYSAWGADFKVMIGVRL